MPFTRPTLTELVDRIQSDIETHVTNGQSLLRRSVLKVLARVYAGVVHLLYSYLGFQAEQLFATTADVEGLEAIADEYGINRVAASKATGLLTLTGSVGLIILAATEFQSSDGVTYVSDEDEIFVGTSLSIEITASEGGDSGNQDAGAILSFVSPIAEVSSQATVATGGLTGGADEETDDDLRERVLLRKQYPPYGGCSYDYWRWMLEYAGVTRAWVFPAYNGAGTVGCAFVMDDSTPYIPNAATVALVRAYLVEHTDPATDRTVGIPVTAEPGLFMITITELTINMTINIYPNTAAVQTLVEAEIQDLIDRQGGLGSTIYLSDIQAALGRVSDLEYFSLVLPVADVTTLTNQIHALGTITFGDY